MIQVLNSRKHKSWGEVGVALRVGTGVNLGKLGLDSGLDLSLGLT